MEHTQNGAFPSGRLTRPTLAAGEKGLAAEIQPREMPSTITFNEGKGEEGEGERLDTVPDESRRSPALSNPTLGLIPRLVVSDLARKHSRPPHV